MLELRRRDAPMTRIGPRAALLMTLPPLLWAGNAVVGRLGKGVDASLVDREPVGHSDFAADAGANVVE